MKELKIIYRYSFWFISGILLHFSFPDKGIPFLGFFALIPSVYRAYEDGYISTFVGSLFFSIVFWTPTINWFSSFHPLAIPAILIPLYLYTMFPFVVLSIVSKIHRSSLSLLTFPFLWVGMEFLRGNGFWSLPLIYIAHTQYHFMFSDNLIFKLVDGAIPSYASIVGVFGVSFLVVTVNVLILLQILKLVDKVSLRSFIPLLVILIIEAFGILNFNNIIKSYDDKKNEGVKVSFSLLQPNFSPWDKLLAGDFEKLEEIKELFYIASKESDILVSCESILRDPVNYYYLRGYKFGIEALNIPKVLGKPVILTFPFLKVYVTNTFINIKGKRVPINQEVHNYYNAALLLDEKGREVSRYFKVHTVPFGEWTPFAEYIPYLRETINAIVGGDITPGNQFIMFNIEVKKIEGPTIVVNAAPLICFEDLYPYITRKYSLMGSQVLINMTNDGWANSVKSQIQHLVAAAYRVLETGIALIRATNTGTTAIIYPNMEIKKIEDFKKSYLVEDVYILNPEKTIFVRFGSVFTNIMIILGFILSLLLGFLRIS